jgi:hypothetical protein
MQRDLKRLFSACTSFIGLAVLAPGSSQAGTPDALLWRDLNRSAFSTTSILADLANIDKQVRAAQVAPVSDSSAPVSSQAGAFQYDSETRQTTGARKLSEEIRATQQLEKARDAEITEHPFWYARFWTHSPLAIPAFLLGGDHHALETPPTEFEKLSTTSPMETSYNNEAELRKFERSISFGNVGK